MSTQENVLIPKENYVNKQAKALELLVKTTAQEKAKLLTVLQRQPLRENITDQKERKEEKNIEGLQEHVLKSLPLLNLC